MTEDIIISSGVVSSGIELDAFMTVLSGGTAVGTVVSNGGSLSVLKGGTVDKTTILSGGELTVHSGGTATDTVEDGGRVEIRGGEVTFAPHTIRGLRLIDDGTEREGYVSATIHSGTIADSATVSDALLDVLGGGSANHTTVFCGGELSVDSGGAMLDTVISGGGSVMVRSGGRVENTAVLSGGSLIVLSGGTATEIMENGGSVRMNDGAVAAFAAFHPHDLVLKNGTNATIHSGTSATGFTVCDKCRLDVLGGGNAKDTVVSGGGYLAISSGGKADETTVSSGGFLYVDRGGRATGIRAEKGARIIFRSISPDTWIQGSFAGGSFEVNGVISNCVLIERGPFDDFDETADPLAEGDTLDVFSGGTAVNVTVSRGGELRISSGGVAVSPVIRDGGLLVVLSGGTALDLKKEEGAKIEIGDGAIEA